MLAGILAAMRSALLSQHRRAITVSAIGIIGVGVAGFGLWEYRTPPVSIPGPDSALPPGISVPPPAAPPPPPASGIPPYTGSPVAVLNGDPYAVSQAAAGLYEKSKRELVDLAVSLAQNPRQPETWMRVAYLKHYYEDNIGARDAYEYVNLIADERAVAYYNLAVLYGYYLKEPAKAASKFRAAIARDPANASFYTGFADFYREVVKDPISAEAALQEGLSKIPAKTNLYVSLGSLYAGMGRRPDAVRAYESALADPAMGPAERAAISREVERLKQAP